MATKSANVTARVQPEIKQQAEEILKRVTLHSRDFSRGRFTYDYADI